MTSLSVTKTRLSEGHWEGVVTSDKSSSDKPGVAVTYLEKQVEGVQLTLAKDGEGWALRIPVPPEAIADGVQVLLIRDVETGETLETVTLLAGEALADDIRVEVALLRAELDMLKKAFRRHCVETA